MSTIADRLPPSTLGPLRQLDRNMLGPVTQIRTDHGYFGDYYARFNIPEQVSCSCGATLQTREHILFDCPLLDKARYILSKAAPDGPANSAGHKGCDVEVAQEYSYGIFVGEMGC